MACTYKESIILISTACTAVLTSYYFILNCQPTEWHVLQLVIKIRNKSITRRECHSKLSSGEKSALYSITFKILKNTVQIRLWDLENMLKYKNYYKISPKTWKTFSGMFLRLAGSANQNFLFYRHFSSITGNFVMVYEMMAPNNFHDLEL